MGGERFLAFFVFASASGSIATVEASASAATGDASCARACVTTSIKRVAVQFAGTAATAKHGDAGMGEWDRRNMAMRAWGSGTGRGGGAAVLRAS